MSEQANGEAGTSENGAQGQDNSQSLETKQTREATPPRDFTEINPADVLAAANMPAEVKSKIAERYKPEPPKGFTPEDEEGEDQGEGENGSRPVGEPESHEETSPQSADKTPTKSKTQQRIDNLVRERGEARDAAEAALKRAEEAERKLAEREEQGPEREEQRAPVNPKGLSQCRSETELNRLVAEANFGLDMLDQNPDGFEVEQNGERKFIDKPQMEYWRNTWNRTLAGAADRRIQLRELRNHRDQFDTFTRETYPEIFDEKTEDYSHAQEMYRQAPFLNDIAGGRLFVARYLAGFKAEQAAKAAKAGKAAGADKANVNGELDPRLDPKNKRFAPPIAPPSASPPQRSVVPNADSSGNRLGQLKENLTKRGGRREDSKAYIEAMLLERARNSSSPQRAAAA